MDKTFKCLKIDLPGHGNSPVLADVSIESMAKEVISILEENDVKSYSVVGHSMGGYVGLELLKLDASCKKLILLNSNYWKDDEKKVEDRRRIADFVMKHKKHFIYESIPHLFLNPKQYEMEVKDLIVEASEMKAEGIATASIAMSERKDFTPNMKLWSSQIMLIQGNEDTIVPTKRLLDEIGITGINLKLLDQSAHMSHIEQTRQVREEIVSFLK